MEPIAIKPASGTDPEMSEEYYLSIGTANATDVVTSKRFVIYKGAEINETMVKSISAERLNYEMN